MGNKVSKSFLMKYCNLKCRLPFSLIFCHFCIWNILQRQWVWGKCQHKTITTLHLFYRWSKKKLSFSLLLWTIFLNWNKIFRSQFSDKKSANTHLIWKLNSWGISSVQSFSHVWLFVTPWIAVRQASLSITNSQSLLKPMFIKSVMPSSHLILCSPLLLLLSNFCSIRVFSNESTLHMRWPKYWSFSSNISLSNEQSGLISFRMDWLDLLAVQGTLKSLLQHHE